MTIAALAKPRSCLALWPRFMGFCFFFTLVMPPYCRVASAGVESDALGASFNDLSTSMEGDAARLAALERGLAMEVSMTELRLLKSTRTSRFLLDFRSLRHDSWFFARQAIRRMNVLEIIWNTSYR